MNMKINDIDITSYKAKLIDRTIATETRDTYTGWYDEALDGTLLAQLREFREIQLKFFLNTETEDEAYKEYSKLIENISRSTIVFEDIDLTFQCYLTGSTKPARVKNGKFIVTVVLRNSLAKGQEVTVSFDVTKVEVRKITVNYYRNWSTTVNYYTDAFDDSDLHELIKSEDVYVSTTEPTATSYDTYFGGLGINLDKYQSEGEQPGRINISSAFDSNTAAALSSIDVYYDKIQTDGVDDIPSGKYFPNQVFTFADDNDKYFEVPITADTKVEDVTVEVTSRWFDQLTDNQLFAIDDADSGNPNYIYQLKSSKLATGSTVSPIESTVYQTNSSSGRTFILVTYEDISSVPMRKHAIVSSNKGESKQDGYYTIVFNGTTLARKPIPDTLVGQTTSKIRVGAAKNCDLARVRIYIKDELVHDLIPINSSVKNCFVNNFDDGLYDVNTFDFIPWTNSNATGAAPASPMVKPNDAEVDPTPVVVVPTDPSVMWLYQSVDDITNDTYEGKLAKNKSGTSTSGQTWKPSAIEEQTFYIVQPVPNQKFATWGVSSNKATLVAEHKDTTKNWWYLECKAVKSGTVYIYMYSDSSATTVIGQAIMKIDY